MSVPLRFGFCTSLISMTRFLILSALVLSSGNAMAQNWDFDARHIAMGNVSTTNISMSMIDEQRRYTSIPLPFGLFQVLGDLDIYNPSSPKFDPVRAEVNQKSYECPEMKRDIEAEARIRPSQSPRDKNQMRRARHR